MRISLFARISLIGLLVFCSLQLGSLATGDINLAQDRFLQDSTGYALKKQWKGDDNSYHYVAEYKGSEESFGNSNVIKTIHMIVSFYQKSTFRIKIQDNDNSRWEIPESFPFPHFKSNSTLIPVDTGDCTVEVQEDPFTFVVTRKDNGEILFDTRDRKFVYTNYYIELGTSLPSQNVYGFGERNYKFKLSPGIYTIWGRDDARIMQNGRPGGNTYSHHPVGLIRDRKGSFFLTLMRNSNAMDVIINENSELVYKIVGGVIDLIFFIGTDYPENLLKSYHNYLGNFTMMPFWSMGYHQSKWGYGNHGMMEDVVTKYINNDLPLDVIWSDIDYMVDKEIFTIATDRYPLDKMRELMTKYKKKWVPIIDPGVKVDRSTGPGGQVGLERDVFLKNSHGGNLVGSVWPGRTYFPDFFHPKAEAYWSEMLDVLYKMVPFSGIWLDMNEVANFVDGEEYRYDKNAYDNIPYNPGEFPLKRKTISLDAIHHGGIVEYDVHGLFSLMENAVTHKFLETKSKLPFILTRSTSMGLGRFSAHWTGDNGASWEFLQISIAGNFNFQIFGIPFVGADICGFMGNTNEELCARWTQLGALYPFARNHHELESRNQEPWTFQGTNRGVSIMETTRIALKTRYALLKWYYSLFIETGGSGSIFRPLMFEYPHEEALYQDGYTDWEFLLGKGLLCTPKVHPGDPVVSAFFPTDTWYDLFTGERFVHRNETQRVLEVKTPFNAPVPLFLRGGHMVHRQNVEHVLSTQDLNDEFEFVAALERSGKDNLLRANGSLMGIQTFDDNSVFYRCMEDNCLYDITITVTREDPNSASIQVDIKQQSEQAKASLDSFGLYGLKLYGLPLEFMTDDEKKVSYALMQFTKNGEDVPLATDVQTVTVLEKGAFKIDFGQAIRVEDGDSIIFELII